MSKIITQCPSCSSLKLNVTKIECRDCSTKFEGQFDIPTLLKLSPEDLQFVLDFVKCSGSLKEMANQQSVSYPTLRNRLNTLITTLEGIESHKNNAKDNEMILKLLEDGKISASEAALMLRR